jgi:hypothetical protein
MECIILPSARLQTCAKRNIVTQNDTSRPAAIHTQNDTITSAVTQTQNDTITSAVTQTNDAPAATQTQNDTPADHPKTTQRRTEPVSKTLHHYRSLCVVHYNDYNIDAQKILSNLIGSWKK